MKFYYDCDTRFPVFIVATPKYTHHLLPSIVTRMMLTLHLMADLSSSKHHVGVKDVVAPTVSSKQRNLLARRMVHSRAQFKCS